jgi:hypothetical protein
MNRYVMCLDNQDHLVRLEVRKVYQVVDDPFAEAHGAIRIIDETGEDYMYEAGRFVPVDLPESVQAVFESVPA